MEPGVHSERTHSRYSPSQRERRRLCKGSDNLIATVDARPSSPFAIEGTKAHEIVEFALRNGMRRAMQAHLEHPTLKTEKLDNGPSNNFYLSVQVMLNYVYGILDEYLDAVMYIEREVPVPLECSPGDGDGLCDVIIFSAEERRVWIIDYKHGAGITKDAKNNPQLRQYSTGVLYGEPCLVDPASVDLVTEAIVQPRAFHKDGYIRDVDVSTYDVWLSVDEINQEVIECMDPHAPLTPGEDQCRFCDAAIICPAREAMALKVAGSQFNQIMDVTANKLPDVRGLDVNRLGYIVNMAPFLEKFLKDAKEYAIELNRRGMYVPGTKLVETDPVREYYHDETETAFKLAALIGCGVTDVITYKTVNLTTGEKLVIEAFKKRAGKGKKKKAAEDAKQAFAFLTTKKSTGTITMVTEDDPRPAVNANHFAQLPVMLPPPQTAE